MMTDIKETENIEYTQFNPINSDASTEPSQPYSPSFIDDQMNVNMAIAQQISQIKTDFNNFKKGALIREEEIYKLCDTTEKLDKNLSDSKKEITKLTSECTSNKLQNETALGIVRNLTKDVTRVTDFSKLLDEKAKNQNLIIDDLDRKLQNSVSDLNKGITQLKKCNTDNSEKIRNISHSLSFVSGNIHTIKSDLSILDARAKADYQSTTLKFNEVNQKINKLNGDNQNLQSLTNKLDKDLELLTNDVKVSNTESADMKNKVEEISNVFADNYVSLNTELNSLCKKINCVEIKSKEDNTRLHSLEKNTESFIKQQAENEKYVSDISTKYENHISETNVKLIKLENNVQSSNNALGEAEKKINTLALKNSFVVEKLDSNSKQIEKLNKSFLSMEDNLIKLMGDNMNLSLDNQAKDKKIEELCQTIKGLLEKYEVANATILDHSTQLSKMTIKLAELENKCNKPPTLQPILPTTLSALQPIPNNIQKTQATQTIQTTPAILPKNNYVDPRRERSKTQPIILKNINMSENSRSINCEVIGTTGNIYNVNLVGYPKCSCPDYQLRGSRCKHIYYVLENVLNVNNPSKEFYSFNELTKSDGYKKI